MAFRYSKRRVRCFLKYGPHGCPHIERHTRRPRLTRAEREETEAKASRRYRRVAHG